MGGGGKGETKSSSDLADIAKVFFSETTPLRQELTNQFLEALTTGGVGARMPIISKAQEQSKQATSQSLSALDTELARTNLAGTPFGARTRAETMQRGQQATAAVPFNIISAMLQQVPGFVTGSNQTVVTGLGQAAGAEASKSGADAALVGALLSPFSFGF